jgi:hypothetical protein
MPVAAVPADKMYLWIMTLEYLKTLYVERKNQWEGHGLVGSGPDFTAENIEDMHKFLCVSYSDYMSWLGMSSEFIERHLKYVPTYVEKVVRREGGAA